MIILVSMCLLGIPCRYDGKCIEKKLPDLFVNSSDHVLIPVCPEQLGGLTTPRDPSEIIDGDGNDVVNGTARVKTIKNADVTSYFIKGAGIALDIAGKYRVEKFIGCSGSPSCSCLEIHNGMFQNILKNGYGVTAALMKKNGIELIDSDELIGKLDKEK